MREPRMVSEIGHDVLVLKSELTDYVLVIGTCGHGA